MIAQEAGTYNGLACHWLSNGLIRLAVTVECGPRVVFCGWEDGGRNLFAETPDVVLDSPNGQCRLIGGHRFWHAPEIVERTYWPDDRPVAVETRDGGARFTPVADGFGIVRELALTLVEGEARVTVEHRLRHEGTEALDLAPWALTMVAMGGVTLLPQPQGNVDAAGVLPNRYFTFWPYSDPADPRLTWGNRIVLVRGTPAGANKLGYRNRHGWLGHWLDGTLFTKEFAPHPEAAHPDNGCNAECYVKDTFMEVESLGPLVRLAPGESVAHEEIWRFHPGVAPIASEDDAVAVAARIGLWPGGQE